MNFNLSKKPEYSLLASLSDEYINLYGVKCYYFNTKRIKPDEIFGEHKRLSIDDSKAYEIFMLFEPQESFGGDSVLNVFGLTYQESLVCFVSLNTMKKIHPKIVSKQGFNFDEILGDIVVFDSGKIMEVSDFSVYSENMNNLFVYSDDKNIFKITLKTYIGETLETTTAKTSDEKPEYEKIDNLEDIFELDTKAQETTKNIQDEFKQAVKSPLKNRKDDYNDVFGGL